MSATLTGIGFLDLAGYTALTAVHGDESAADVVGRLCGRVRESLGEGDDLVKSIGDAVLVRSATAAGLADLARRACRLVDAEPAFPVLRIGLHAGPVVVRDGDVFGTTVNVAARVAVLAAGGQVLATRAVADALDTGDVLRRLGAVPLKGSAEPVELLQHGLRGPIPAGAGTLTPRRPGARAATTPTVRQVPTPHRPSPAGRREAGSLRGRPRSPASLAEHAGTGHGSSVAPGSPGRTLLTRPVATR